MNKRLKELLKVVSILLAIIIICFVGLIIFLRSTATPLIPDGAVQVTDGRYEKYADVNTIREITMTPDFPTFDSEIYEYVNENGEKEIYLKCVFNPTVPEDTVWNLSGKFKGGDLHQHSEGSSEFIRGWSKKKYMQIPTGIDEEMVFEISMYCDDQNFTITYKHNPCTETVDKDSLNRYLGVTLPEFTIVNYVAPYNTTLQLKTPISKEAYRQLEKNEWCEHKSEDDGTSICWIQKKDSGEYSTWIEIDDQKNTVRLSKNKN